MMRSRGYIALFAGGTSLIVAAAWAGIASDYRRTTAEWRGRLISLAADRAAILALWLDERRADYRVVSSLPPVRALLAGDAAAAAAARATLDSAAAGFGYEATYLFGNDGVLLATNQGAPAPSDRVREVARDAAASDTVGVAVVDARFGSALIAVAGPARAGRPPRRVDGALVLLTSPTRMLYPLVQRDPTRTGEMTVGEVKGTTIVSITPFRHRPADAPPLQLSLDTVSAERRAMFLGEHPNARYRDYRGMPVMAAAARVPRTNWIVTRKIDDAEALENFNRNERLILIAMALAIAALGLSTRSLARRAEASAASASAALEASERRFRDLMESVQLIAVMLDRQGRVTFCNDALLTLTGWRRDEALGADWFSQFLPKQGTQVRPAFDRAIAAGRLASHVVEGPVLTTAGERRTIQWNNTLLRDADGTVVGLAALGADVTTLRVAEEAIRVSEERYRSLVEHARDIIFALAPDGTITSLNPAFETVTGWSRADWIGRPFTDLLAPQNFTASRQTFYALLRADAGPGAVQLALRTRDGGVRIGEFTAQPQLKDGRLAGLLGVCRDITERLRLEEQVRQSSRMEAVGQLAGGIAHDFNNLLTVIIGSTELLLTDLPEGSTWREDAQEIRRSAGRAATLTRQLLAYSRRQVLTPRLVDLNDIVTGAAGLLRRLIGEDIKLMVRLAPGMGAVRADTAQLEQVIVNLAVNARDAMPGGGTLTIETSEVHNEAPIPLSPGAVPPGRWLRLLVRDTGVGMDDTVRSHAFEPFFTTKEPGKGTGLGLASAYGVIKQSEGFIGVESAPGAGATFMIYLPRASGAAGSDAAPSREAGRPRVSGAETVLVVEDEAKVRAVARQALTRHGYRVLEASGAEEALALTVSLDGPLDLLLTDVVMPGLSGPALAERMVQRRPGLRVLFMSGYASEAVESRGTLGAGAQLLEKPFTPDELAARVRAVLDAGGA